MKDLMIPRFGKAAHERVDSWKPIKVTNTSKYAAENAAERERAALVRICGQVLQFQNRGRKLD